MKLRISTIVWLGSTILLLGAGLTSTRADARRSLWAINVDLAELLSGIDFVPSRSHFDAVHVGSGDLITIARDQDEDAGLRIRAYRALSHYPGEATVKALTDAIDEHSAVPSGVDTIYLRAAMDSLAVVAREAGVPPIAPQLSHPSRDVRAASASALAVCGSPAVIPLLRERVNDPDEVAQVKTACIEAIRALTELL